MRVKRGVTKRRRHKKILESAAGFRGRRSRTYRLAAQAILTSGQKAYVGRKLKKRTMRKLWITKLSAALEPHDLSYSRFINLLKTNNIELDRKILSQLAIKNPEVFDQIVKTVTS